MKVFNEFNMIEVVRGGGLSQIACGRKNVHPARRVPACDVFNTYGSFPAGFPQRSVFRSRDKGARRVHNVPMLPNCLHG
jgi:hypothetical protein